MEDSYLCMNLHKYIHMCAEAHTYGQKTADSLVLELTDRCGLPYWCWELNLGLLLKQHVLLTADPSLLPHILLFKIVFI